jgi:hypothetical protein
LGDVLKPSTKSIYLKEEISGLVGGNVAISL